MGIYLGGQGLGFSREFLEGFWVICYPEVKRNPWPYLDANKANALGDEFSVEK